MTDSADARAYLTRSADLCVKCGLCLPHCPTYQIAREEGESPRGRIAMLDAMGADRLSASADLNRHLQQCLGCRACERVCPAGVPYGSMIDTGREQLAARGMLSARPARLAARILSSPALLPVAATVVRSAQNIGATKMIGRMTLPGLRWLSRLCRLLPENASRFSDTRSDKHVADKDPAIMQGQLSMVKLPLVQLPLVQLHRGCVSTSLDGQSIRDAITVLERVGYQVVVPGKQGCCGAMDQHAGRSRRAKKLALKNIAAFKANIPIVSIASGCASTLREYQEIAGKPGHVFSKNVVEISRFLADRLLADHRLLDSMHLKPVRNRIFLHTPCTLRNVLRDPNTTKDLLERIPGIDIAPADENHVCCGAGGTHVIQFPKIADALGGRLIDAAKIANANSVVTSNIGCAMHLGGLIRKQRLDMDVLHPVSLLARSIRG